MPLMFRKLVEKEKEEEDVRYVNDQQYNGLCVKLKWKKKK